MDTMRNWLSLFENRTFFHVTPSENVESILSGGLVPRTGARSEKLGDHGIFLFRSAEDAEDAVMNWMGDEFGEDEPLTLLRVVLSDGAETSEEAFEVVCHEPIPANQIEVLGEL